MLLCMCNYNGKNTYFHEWIGKKKKTGNDNKKVKFLADLYPNKKMDDIEMLASIMNDKDIKSLGQELGLTNKEIDKILK